MPPRWDWVVTELAGLQTRLEYPRERKLSLVLDDAATASFSLDGRDPQAADIIELATDLTIYRDGVAIFRGRIGNSDDTLDQDKHTVSYSAVDYRGLLDRRIMWIDNQAGTGYSWNNVAQSQIAWDMVKPDAQPGTQWGPGGNLGITRGPERPNPDTPRTYSVAAGTKISEAITTLGTVWEGFSWWISPDLVFHTTWRGTDRDLAIVFGTTAKGCKRQVDTSNYANSVRVSGSTDQQGVAAPAAIRLAPDIATRPEGRLALQVGLQDLKTQALVEAQADAELDARGSLVPSYTFDLVPGVWDPNEFGVGDRLHYSVRSGRLNVDGYDRCKQLDITIDDSGNESVSITLGTQRADLLRLFKAVPDRLERLERR